MKTNYLRIWSIILIFAIVFNMLPLHAMAEELDLGDVDTEATAQLPTQEEIQIVDEVIEGRSEYSKEFQLSNGLHMAAVYDSAVHYQEDGIWKEIDNTLKLSDNRSENVYTNTAGVWQVMFPQNMTRNNGVSIIKDGYMLNFRMSGELHKGVNVSEVLETGDNAEVSEAGSGDLDALSMPSDTEPIEPNNEASETADQSEVTEVPDGTAESTAETEANNLSVPSNEAEVVSEESILNAIGAEKALGLTVPAEQTAAEVIPVDSALVLAEDEYAETVADKIYSRLEYQDIYRNTDLVFELHSNLVKESIVINQYDSTLYGYTYLLNVGQMVPVLQETGEIALYDEEREELIMIMPAPYLVDNAGASNYDVSVELNEVNDGYILSYLLPQEWLGSSERQWPVVLDPAVMPSLAGTNIRDVTLSTGGYLDYTDGYLHCGYSSNTVLKLSHIFLKYTNLPVLTSADVIVSASVRLFMLEKNYTSGSTAPVVEVHKVRGTWESETITLSNSPGFYDTVEDYAVVNSSGQHFWDVTDIVREWYAGENTGMMFKLTNAAEAQQNLDIVFSSSDNPNYITSRKPGLTIIFRNNNGLENYWDYTTTSAGRAGTGYINQYTGNLIWIRGDMGFGGNRMPVSISHIYNANDNGNNLFGMGYGWRTNFNQRVYLWTTDTSYYVWEDSDGTSHYFKYTGSGGTYVDEDGLELKLKVTSSQRTITDKYGNTSVFDSTGRLISMTNNQTTPSTISITYSSGWLISRITDGAGRKYNFTYSNGLLNRISFVGTGSTELSYVTFGYSGSDLTTVTDKDSKKSTYTYTGSHLLASAQDVDGYKIVYTYTTTTAGKPSRIRKVEEFSGTKAGSFLDFAYAQNQTTLTDHQGNVQTIQFNNWGNTISAHDDQGRGQYAGYAINDALTNEGTETRSGNNTAKGNQLTLSSKLQNTVGNVQRDTSFENGVTWGVLHSDRVSRHISTTVAYHGSKSLALVRTTAGTISGVYSPYFTIPAKTTYTFSAYVKTGTGSAGISISDDTNVIYSDFLPANTDWTRLEVSFTNNTNAAVSVTARFNTREAGTAYMDCVQIEQAPTASRYNLVENGDFRRADYGWSSYAGRTTASTPAPAIQLDSTVYTLAGNPTGTNRISQTVPVKGNAGDGLVLAGWGKANSAPLAENTSTTREFSLIGTVNYTDGTTDKFTIQFNPYVDTWQYAAAAMVAQKAYNSVKVEVAYDYNVNTAWFDGIQLYKEEFGTRYSYDGNGNMTEVEDMNKQTTTYGYNAANDLVSQALPTGVALTYTYDTHHNVLTASTSTGETYNFTYDTYGNNTSVSITATGGNITSQATYTSDGNRLATTKDALNNVTTYDYDANTNVLKSVTAPNGGTTAYTYDNMYRLAKASMAVDSQTLSAEYTYENDLLKTLKTGSTTYSFTYGDFALRTGIKAGEHSLATYTYTGDRNNYLQKLAYGNGNLVQYTYDEQGRVTKQTYEDNATVTYQYDNNGDLASAADSASGITTKYHYDLIGRLGKVTHNGTNFSHTSEYGYNAQGNLEQLFDTILGSTYKSYYYYDTDNRISQVYDGGVKEDYTYDNAGRVTQKKSYINKTKHVLTESFTYQARTSRVATLTNDSAGDYNVTLTYDYDANGNITSVSDGTHTTRYEYDKANQLTRENNQAAGKTWIWTYDNAGNITSRKEYAYTTATSPGTATDTVIYTYGDTNGWGDLLTGYDGNTVTSDAIGNTLSDGTRTYTWKHGRQLATTAMNGKTWTYTYNADGMRTKRVSGNTAYTYYYNGDMLRYLDYDSNTTDSNQAAKLYFVLDAAGNPIEVSYRPEGSTTTKFYYYVQNLQGDVIALVDSANGNTVVTYTYDAWGNVLNVDGSLKTTLGVLNPFRYRGYVYDSETGLYYVSSRYYDPEIGRFINADSVLAGMGGSIQGYNMFAYCFNNPVNMADYSGNWPQWIEDTWEAIKDFFSSATNSTGGEFEDGIFRGSGSLTGGYSEVNGRLQVNSKDSKTNGMLGAFGKVSVGNASGKVGIGNNDVSLSFKGVGDGLTASAQAGIQYKNGAGLAAKAKAAVLSGRVTAELDLFGWQIEFGVSGDLLSVGAEAVIGVFPNEGFTAKASVGAGLFGVGFVFRVKPAQ